MFINFFPLLARFWRVREVSIPNFGPDIHCMSSSLNFLISTWEVPRQYIKWCHHSLCPQHILAFISIIIIITHSLSAITISKSKLICLPGPPVWKNLDRHFCDFVCQVRPSSWIFIRLLRNKILTSVSSRIDYSVFQWCDTGVTGRVWQTNFY